MNKIIEDTITRFDLNTSANPQRWMELYTFLEELDIVKLSDAQYDSIWSKC